jgi:hypothetical protein
MERAPWLQPVATGRRWDSPENGSNRPIRNRWQPDGNGSGAHGKGRVDATPLFAKEGLLSLLRKRGRVPPTLGRRLESETLEGRMFTPSPMSTNTTEALANVLRNYSSPSDA